MPPRIITHNTRYRIQFLIKASRIRQVVIPLLATGRDCPPELGGLGTRVRRLQRIKERGLDVDLDVGALWEKTLE